MPFYGDFGQILPILELRGIREKDILPQRNIPLRFSILTQGTAFQITQKTDIVYRIVGSGDPEPAGIRIHLAVFEKDGIEDLVLAPFPPDAEMTSDGFPQVDLRLGIACNTQPYGG